MRVLIAFLLMTTPAFAALPCMPKEAALAELLSRYGEAPLFDAKIAGKSVVITWLANLNTGTWTMMISPDSSVGCIAMAGGGFKPVVQGKAL